MIYLLIKLFCFLLVFLYGSNKAWTDYDGIALFKIEIVLQIIMCANECINSKYLLVGFLYVIDFHFYFWSIKLAEKNSNDFDFFIIWKIRMWSTLMRNLYSHWLAYFRNSYSHKSKGNMETVEKVLQVQKVNIHYRGNYWFAKYQVYPFMSEKMSSCLWGLVY